MTHVTYQNGTSDHKANLFLPPSDIDEGTFNQINDVLNHPNLYSDVAIMPDTHLGYGVPIGCVFTTRNAIIPNAVGVDIGCGMTAYQTDILFDESIHTQKFWEDWADKVRRDVPTGFNSHKVKQDLGYLDMPLKAAHLQPLMEKKAAYQLGTLGGGNHFIEAQHDQDGYIWLMVHSGSRHLGLKIAEYYHELAMKEAEEKGLDVHKDLAPLSLKSSAGHDYLYDMTWAIHFATASRGQMMWKMAEALGIDLHTLTVIDTPHNYASIDLTDAIRHMLVTHRKGATSARKGEYGIIPGSMGSKSYIIKGKGNPDSLQSCSHGAGRARGRNATRKMFSVEEFQEALAGTFSKATKGTLDEAPMAYKDIETVIHRQDELVSIENELTPIITIKGDSKARDD